MTKHRGLFFGVSGRSSGIYNPQNLCKFVVKVYSMAIAHEPHTELNPVQVSLLRLFSRPMSEKEVYDLKKYLLEYYNRQLEDELSRVVNEKGYTQKDFDSMLNGD